MVIRFLTVAPLLVAACTADDPQKSVFEKLVKEAKPHIEALKPFATEVVRFERSGPDVDTRIVEACRNPIAELRALKGIDFRVPGAHPPFGYSVSECAGDIVDQQALYCDQLRNPQECVRFCVRSWTELVLAIEHFRGDAAAHGVDAPDLFHQR
jgi:hypothetical protein